MRIALVFLVLSFAARAQDDWAVAGVLTASGDQHLAEGRAAQAVRAYEAATELAPESAWTWTRLAEGYAALGQRNPRVLALWRAYSLAPNRAAHRALALELGLYGRPVVSVAPVNMDCWGAGGSCDGSPQAARIAVALGRHSAFDDLPKIRAVRMNGDRIEFETDRELFR